MIENIDGHISSLHLWTVDTVTHAVKVSNNIQKQKWSELDTQKLAKQQPYEINED